MPDQSGALSHAEKEQVRSFLATHGAIKNCPQCGRLDWGIGDHVVQLPVTFVVTTYPAVFLICKNCSYFRFHSAVAMGIVSREQPAKKATGGGGDDGRQ